MIRLCSSLFITFEDLIRQKNNEYLREKFNCTKSYIASSTVIDRTELE